MRKRIILIGLLLMVFAWAFSASAESLDATVYARSIKMSKKTATIQKPNGDSGTLKLNAATSPVQSVLFGNPVIWKSSNEQVATVDQNGLVTAVGEGVTKISASVQGASRTLSVNCKVTVKAIRVSSVVLSETGTIFLDHTDSSARKTQLSAQIKPANATFQSIAWNSSNDSVATVDAKGVVTAVGAGEAKITATVDGGRKAASVLVRVRDLSGMTRITLSAAGDVVLGGDVRRGSYDRFRSFLKSGGNGLDFGYTFQYVKKVFENDDISIVNLEGPLTNTGYIQNPDRTYNFCAPPEYVNILKAGNIEVANVVNNHISDYTNSYALTRRTLVNAGIALSDKSVTNNCIVTVKGVRVGFLGIQTAKGTGVTSVRKTVKAARQKCDLLVVSFHFCSVAEYSQAVTAQQKALSHAAIDSGAAMVIGHHPHVFSGIEQYKGAYIYYDLGSLVMAGENGRHSTYIAQTTLLYDAKTGYSECLTPTIYPAFTCDIDYTEEVRGKKVKRNNCQPTLLAKGSAKSDEVVTGIRQYSRNLSNPGKFNVG